MMKRAPKEIRSVRLSRETLDQFNDYANFYGKLTGVKPSLSRTTDAALLYYIKDRLQDTKDTLALAIQNIEELQNQKGNEPEEEAN